MSNQKYGKSFNNLLAMKTKTHKNTVYNVLCGIIFLLHVYIQVLYGKTKTVFILDTYSFRCLMLIIIIALRITK